MKRYAFILGCMSSALFVPSMCAAAGFDCYQASTSVEQLICGNPELSALDEILADAYTGARAKSQSASRITRDQRQWLIRRNACAEDVGCLRTAYEERLRELWSTAPDVAEDACFSVSPLSFPDRPTKVCRSAISRLLVQQLDFQQMGGPLLAYAYNGTELRTCLQYIALVGIAAYGWSRMESFREYSIYLHTCGVLYAMQRALKPQRSYLGPNPVDLRILPPTRLPHGPTADAQDELEAAFSRGESADDFLAALKSKDSNFDREAYLDGWSIVLHGRADFDGDGIEDALVSFSYSAPAPAHYFGYGIGVLKRTSPDGPARWIDFRDFSWAAVVPPNSAVESDALHPALRASYSAPHRGR